jgi:hypothetical protein
VSLRGRLCFRYGVLLEGIGVLLVFDLLWIRVTVLAFLVPLWAPLGRTSILYIKAKGITDHDALDPHLRSEMVRKLFAARLHELWLCKLGLANIWRSRDKQNIVSHCVCAGAGWARW